MFSLHPDLVQHPQLDIRDRMAMEMLVHIYLTGIRQNPAFHQFNTHHKIEISILNANTKLQSTITT